MFNDKFLAEMLMYDFNIANKQKIKVYIVLESGKKKIASEAHWQRHTSYSIVAQKFSH